MKTALSSRTLLTLRIATEHDVVLARQRAVQVTSLLGFNSQDQTRIATAVSEIARNAFEYTRSGSIRFVVHITEPSFLEVEIKDSGRGIANLQSVLDGNYKSATGMGLGIVGARRLMDDFAIESSSAGTTVSLRKWLQVSFIPNEQVLAGVTAELIQRTPSGILSEVQQHNQEMLQAMDELREQQQQLVELNRELEDTNRGVVALYAELDERAAFLRRANELKSHFLSNVSHEFRTPLNAILSLSRMLADRVDGDLTSEQETQVMFIRRSAESLAQLVDDLLDLAKVEAGKISIRPSHFEVESLFSALRGMLKPLLTSKCEVELVFDEAANLSLETDEGKLSQILRNFISNAIKFTAAGEVRVSVESEGENFLRFCVADTGTGIGADDLEYIFEEFSQLENPMHQRSKGTGLGLPLARKLAELLGGFVHVESEIGVGSRFYAVIPRVYQGAAEVAFEPGGHTAKSRTSASNQRHDTPGLKSESTGEATTGVKVLLIDNDPAHCYLLRSRLPKGIAVVLEAHDGKTGLQLALQQQPQLIFLDLVMPNMDGFAVLEALKSNPLTSEIPVVINTSQELSVVQQQQLLSQSVAILSKTVASEEEASQEVLELMMQLQLLPASENKNAG